jgi:hypothetical protein
MRHSSWWKAPASALLAVLALFMFGGTASAASTWLPDYDPQTKIYVDPALANHATHPVVFDATFRQELNALSRRHNLDIYVIATQQGDELSGDSKRWAPELLHTPLWNKWTRSSSFRERDKLILLWVRWNSDPSKNSIAARAGSRLHSYGINRAHFNSQSGPVIRAIKANIPGAGAQAALLDIARNINADVDAHLAKSAPAPVTSTGGGGGSGGGDGGLAVLLVVGVVVIGGVILLVVSMSSRSRSSSYSPTSGGTTCSGANNTGSTNSGSDNNGLGVGGVIAGGVLGGLAASALTESEAQKAKNRKRDDSGSTTGSDATTTTTAATCGSAPASSCSSGSSCGGGGCGGGGCGGGGCGGG